MSEIKTAIGLMSGTSMDGVDIALLRSDARNFVERLYSATFPYPLSVRELLQKALVDASGLSDRNQRPGCLGDAEKTITTLHVEAVRSFLEANNMQIDDIDLIGFHGQTVLHRPDLGWSVQLGDGFSLARETGIACVFDMRLNDMLHGGQGAPLVPVYHKALAAGLPRQLRGRGPIAFVNIGGISNISWVGDDLIAFDVGPGNALIDQWVQTHAGIPYDEGGRIAAEGEVNHAFVNQFLSHDFFEKPVPKSLDRNDFLVPKVEAGNLETIARSLAFVTARAIFKACDHLPEKPLLWIICGGGRHNPHILHDLEVLVTEDDARVVTAEEVELNGDSMEAEAWAYLAIRASFGLPLSGPRTTGCCYPVSGGVIALPDCC